MKLFNKSPSTASGSASAGKSLYALLGVENNATQAQMDIAYRKVRETYALADSPAIRDRIDQLEYAYELLSNPVRRRVYDTSLATEIATLDGDDDFAQQGATSTQGKKPNLTKFAIAATILITLVIAVQWVLSVQQRNKVARLTEEAITRAEAAESDMRASISNKEIELARQRLAQEERQSAYESTHGSSSYEWSRQDSYQAQREQYEQRRAEREREQRRDHEAYVSDQQAEQERYAAQERVDRERRSLLAKLISEKRFAEAKQIAKDTNEIDRINAAENNARPNVTLIK